jgi:hypothetical protein
VRLFADVERLRGEATNVLGRVRGARPGKSVLVCAHYDHLGLGGSGSLAPEARGEVHNGADDNASGTAVALEIARLFAARPPERGDLVVALWSGEEIGLLGSEHWAEHPTVPLDELALCVNLDMVGRADAGLVALGAGSAEPLAGWLDELGERSSVALEVVASGQGVGGSDHQTFLKREVPAVHLFTGLHSDYHRPSDDVERFQAEGAAEVCALAAGLARRALDGADQLAFVPPPEPKEGERKIQAGFNAWFGSIPSYTFEGPGVLFDGISPGSPAERAGLLEGDVLRRLGDVEIETIYDFTYALQRYKAGDVVRVVYLRDGEPQELSLALSSRGVK